MSEIAVPHAVTNPLVCVKGCVLIFSLSRLDDTRKVVYMKKETCPSTKTNAENAKFSQTTYQITPACRAPSSQFKLNYIIVYIYTLRKICDKF